jgi:putative zinc finger/helix-turn-helix YgiT family protein
MARPFPWKCRKCGHQAVREKILDYATEMEHDGRLYSLTVPSLKVLECEDCHNRTLSDDAMRRIIDALRVKAELLTPAEIREQRKRLGLKQEDLAKLLRVAKETVSRWESDKQIQQRAMNDFLEVFFNVPEAREFLRKRRGMAASAPATASQILVPDSAGSQNGG